MKKCFLNLFFVLCVPAVVVAQKHGWHMLDLEKDSFYGIGVNKAYQEILKGKTPHPVIVAILDAGADIAHEDLADNIWLNTKEQIGDKDIDGNGYVGDLHGWNFLGNKTKQITNESLEQQRVYHKFKHQFENVKGAAELKKKDRELYRQWLMSKKLISRIDTLAPRDIRSEIIGDKYEDLKDRYYGNTNLMGGASFHGTHVAGIIGAVRDNRKGMNGVADAVKLMIIRAVPNGDEHDKDIALGIRYAVDNGAKVINMSFAKRISPYRHFVEDAIKYAGKKGVLLINGAGNDQENIDSILFYPTSFFIKGKKRAGNMVTVGASGPNINNLIAGFSNYGELSVDVFAPGMAIYSTIENNRYIPLDGTSMASPVVAGLAALIMGYYPKLSVAQVKEIIEQSVTKIDFPVAMPGKNGRMVPMTKLCRTGGIVNAYNALLLAEKITARQKATGNQKQKTKK